MKKTMIVLTALLALAPALVSGQQGPPAGRGLGWREGMVAPRARQLWRAPYAFQGRVWQGRMRATPGMRAMQGRMARQGRGLMLPGRMQAWQGGALMQGRGPLGPLGNPQIRQQLNLTDDQVKQLDELQQARRAEVQKQQETLRAERQQLLEQGRAERQKLMDAMRASREQLQAQRQQEQSQLHERLQQILTAEQREKLEQLENAPPPAPGMRRGWMARPDSIR